VPKIAMVEAYQDTKGCHRDGISRDPLANSTSQRHMKLHDQLRAFKYFDSKWKYLEGYH